MVGNKTVYGWALKHKDFIGLWASEINSKKCSKGHYSKKYSKSAQEDMKAYK